MEYAQKKEKMLDFVRILLLLLLYYYYYYYWTAPVVSWSEFLATDPDSRRYTFSEK
jgi:hypothetical protein